MRYFLVLVTSILIVACSRTPVPLDIKTINDLFKHNEKFYLYDGEFYLSQNWYSPPDNFEMSECDDYLNNSSPVCLIPIKVINNTFDFIDYYGVNRTCTFYQNQDLSDTYQSIFLWCEGDTHQSIYSINFIGNKLLIQEFPHKEYKYLLETKAKEDLVFFTGSFKDIKSLSTRNRDIIDMYADIDRNLTLSSENHRWFVYSDDIILNDGSGGEIAGEIMGAFTCNYLLQLPIDCSSIAGSIGRDLTENNGETITQNLCINYDAINNEGYSYHHIWVCEKFDHPNNVDFSEYIPRYFSLPEVYPAQVFSIE
tara:strand:- start:482 stop:1411 length:930 start_codon:yes stop_codon:yes gene_type:complete